jgi:titin
MSFQPAAGQRARLSVEALESRLAPATFTVTTAADAGAGSLRDAITRANANPGRDIIAFAIGSGLQQIRVQTALPIIRDRVAIAGQTQPGYAGSPLILVNGFAAGAGTNGLVVARSAAGSVIHGLGINQFNGDAVQIRADNCRVRGNYIGALWTGTEELSNAGNGVHLLGHAAGNVIGGTTPATRNIISGNDINGILIEGAGARGNLVIGNHIGTGARGTEFIGNGVADTPSELDGAGIRIAGGASGNVIGGTTPGTRNLISANTEYGINIDAASGNAVLGNFIGTDASGTADLGNFEVGVRIVNGSAGNVIGGSTAAARNVISGNGRDGVHISGVGTRGNVVGANRIGAAAKGAAHVGNGADGVRVDGGSSGNAVVSNVVAFNVVAGIEVEPGTDTTLRDNRLIDNGA